MKDLPFPKFKKPISSKFRADSAFSLIEVMMVLGLMALMATLVITNTDSLLRGFGPKPLPEILDASVQEARFLTAKLKEPAYLTFDSERSVFLVQKEDGGELFSLESGYSPEDRSVEIEFFATLPDRGLIGVSNAFSNRRPVDRVMFHPDRSSNPFMVSLKYEDQVVLIRYDPFSDARLEESN